MTLQQLIAFKAVIDSSFSEAALERGNSQASISQSIHLNSLTELATRHLITYEGYDKDTCTAGNGYFQDVISQLKPAYRVKESSTIFGMIAKGLGFSILPRVIADPLPKDIKVLIFIFRLIGLFILQLRQICLKRLLLRRALLLLTNVFLRVLFLTFS